MNCSSRSPIQVRVVLVLRLSAVLLLLCWSATGIAAESAERLTDDGVFKRDPVFIDEGTALVYCYDEHPDLIRTLRLSLTDGTSAPLFSDVADKHHIEPAFSPDGQYIAYTQCTGNLSPRLVIRNLQNNEAAYVTHSGRGGTRSPTFTPDGKRVVYAFAETGPQQLWSVNLQGKEKRQLTETEGISNWPTFSPDGQVIVFANSRTNNYEIYTMKADGSEHRQLTDNRVMDIRPALSPDGKQIAFTSTRDGNYEVYTMRTDGTGIRRLTNHPERDDYPAWHPDGERLIVVSERDGQHDLYLLQVAPLGTQPDDGNVARK